MFPYCTYLEQGQALAAEMREIFYTSDTQNLFTVLSMNREENFALSYDVTHVTKHTDHDSKGCSRLFFADAYAL